MTSSRRILKYTGIFMIMELGTRIMDAAVSVVLARYLAPQGYGLLAFALSFSSLFSILPGFGMGSLSTRDVSRDRTQLNRYVVNGFLAKIPLSLATVAMMAGAAWFWHFPGPKCQAIGLAAVLMLFEANLTYALSFFQAVQRVASVARINLTVRLGWVLGSLAVIAMHGGIAHLLAIRAVITGLGLLATVLILHFRIETIRWEVDTAFIVRFLKASFPFLLFKLYGTLYMDIDTVMLSVMRGDVMTGWYASAQKFLRVLTFVPNSFCAAMLPVISSASKDQRGEVVVSITRSCKYLLLIGLPIAGAVCSMADPIIRLLYGPNYQGAVPALQILVWAVPFSFLNGAMIVAVAAVGREKTGSVCLIFGALFSSLSNLLVIPLFGHLGAASTTVTAETCIFFLQLRVLKQELPMLRLWPAMRGIIAASAGMSVFAWLIRKAPLAVAAPMTVVTYACLLVAVRALEPEDWQMLTGLLKRRAETKPS